MKKKTLQAVLFMFAIWKHHKNVIVTLFNLNINVFASAKVMVANLSHDLFRQ